MGRKLYVGNLPYRMEENELQEMFEQAGEVESVKIIMDKTWGISKGFGFVVMATDEGAQEAIQRYHGVELFGRELVVDEARPKPSSGLRPRSRS